MKSLKSKMLGKKIMLSLVAAGVMSVGVCGSAWADNIVGTVKYGEVVQTVANTGTVIVGSATIENVSVEGTTRAFNLYNSSDMFTVLGKNILIEATERGISQSAGSNLILGNTEAKESIVNINSAQDGILVLNGGSKLTINADKLEVKANGTFGIHAQNGTEEGPSPSNATSINIEANEIVVKNTGSNSIGLSAFSHSRMNINGNLSVEATNALDVRGNSIVNINTDGAHTTKLKGDIVFETPNSPGDAQQSGKIINSFVTINFNGADSVWEGRSYQEYKIDGKYEHITELEADPYHGNVTGFKISFNDGATWNNTGDSFVNELTMNDGVVSGGSANIQVLKGTKATFKNSVINLYEKFDNDYVTLDGSELNFKGSALNIGGSIAFANKGHLDSDGDITLKAGSTILIDDLSNHTTEAAITAAGTVTAEKGAKVAITKAEEGTYKIVEANKVVNNMTDDDIQYESGMMTGTWVNTDTEMNLTVKAANLAAIAITTEENKDFLQEAVEKANELAKNPETKGFADLVNTAHQILVAGENSNAAKQAVRTALAGAMQSGEVGGATSTAVSIVNNVAGITGGHMSIATPAPAGGKGVGLMAKDSGAGVWAQYVHGKDKADALPMNGGTTKYSNSYSGIVVGADFKQVNKFQSGVAFNYVDGDGSSVFNSAISGHTDFKAYGITYYGAIKNDTVNTMFDVSYNRSKADSEQQNIAGPISASQKTNTWSVGTTVEKAFTDGKNGAQIIPYVGARYMRIGTDDYANSIGIKTAVDNQNVFLIPVGIKFRQENKYKSGWTVTPKADLSYIWALGDTDNDLTVSAPGLDSTSRLGYTVMDKGSFLGAVGLEASKNNWTYGISYSYQKGDYQRSDKYFFDIKYTF